MGVREKIAKAKEIATEQLDQAKGAVDKLKGLFS